MALGAPATSASSRSMTMRIPPSVTRAEKCGEALVLTTTSALPGAPLFTSTSRTWMDAASAGPARPVSTTSAPAMVARCIILRKG